MLHTAVREVRITDDFDLRKIAESGQCFRWTALPDGTWRVLHGADCLYIRALGGGVFGFDCPEEALPRWLDYFDPETGLMKTGWVNIDGVEYYLNEIANANFPYGALCTGKDDLVTPDGSIVDKNGRKKY